MQEKRVVLRSDQTKGDPFLAVGDCHIFVSVAAGHEEIEGSVGLEFKSPNPGAAEDTWVLHSDNSNVLGYVALAYPEGVLTFRGAPGIHYRVVSETVGAEATLVATSVNIRRVGVF